MGQLPSNTRYRGDFEARVTALLAELRRSPDETIVFIDEVHLLVRAGGSDGGIDVANLLKPALSRNGPRFIGATTPADFEGRLCQDTALARRFRTIYTADPAGPLQGAARRTEAARSSAIDGRP
jgi:ATP-dependent Clp protease ATP-binding subunit ClpA